MAKYNIYKIRDGKAEELATHLAGKGFQLVSTQLSEGYTMRTYFAGPDDANMWWLEQYGENFFGANTERRNKIYSGAVLAEKQGAAFILPFGKAHFFIQEYIVFNFGLEMAEKIADPEQAKMKSLKRFGGRTSKSLTSYNAGAKLDFSSGESAEYLKLKPSDTEAWGAAYVHFGTSVQFGSLELSPDQLGRLLDSVVAALAQDGKFSIPLMRPIQDEVQEAALYKKLGKLISEHDARIDFVDYEVYGTDFVFSQQTHIRLKFGNTRSELLSDLSTSDIVSFASANNIDLQNELQGIKVQVVVDGQAKYTTPLLNLIEYHSDDNVLLYRGKWFAFNNSFLKQLHQELAGVQVSKFGDVFSEQEFGAWRDARLEGVKYRERFVIEKIKELHGFEIYDREIEYLSLGRKKYALEVGDIYDATEKRMLVVKIGEPRDFGYAFDQATALLHQMQGKKFKPANGEAVEIETIVVLLLFRSERELESATSTSSLIFELKLNELRKLALEKSVKLEIQHSTIT